MQFETLLSLIIGGVILIIAVVSFVVFSLKKLEGTIARAADALYFETTRKSDLLPMYIELLSKYFSRNSFKELIEERSQSMHVLDFGADKKQLEVKLWMTFEDIIKSAGENQEVAKDLQLVALNKDLNEAKARVETTTEIYNKLVKTHNQWAGFFLLKPLTSAFKLKKFESY